MSQGGRSLFVFFSNSVSLLEEKEWSLERLLYKSPYVNMFLGGETHCTRQGLLHASLNSRIGKDNERKRLEWEWIGKAGEEGNPVWPLDSVQMLSLGGLLSPEAGGTSGGGAVECDLCSRLPSAMDGLSAMP